MDRSLLQKQFLPSIRKIHGCMKSRPMGGFLHSDTILLSIYFHSTDTGEDSLRVHELGRCSHISPPALSRCLRNMEKDGLIRRTIDADDRRSLRVELTDTGKKRAEDLADSHSPCFDRIFQAMGDEDAAELVRLTGIFSDLLEQEVHSQNLEERSAAI